MTGNLENKKRMEGWDVTSPESEGLHKCIQPGIQDCKAVSIYRVNLNAGSVFELESGELEMNPVLIKEKLLLAVSLFRKKWSRWIPFI